MDNNYNKIRLFKLMESVNPEFNISTIKEEIGKINSDTPVDVINAEKALERSDSIQMANSRIGTPQEFQQAFQDWFATTGFNPQTKPLSISQAQALVRNAMKNLGYN